MYNFFIHSSVDGHPSCFHVLAVVNSAAMNNGIHVSYSILVSSGYMLRSGIAGSSVSSVQLLSRVQLCATPWIAARQASLSITNSRSSPKLMCIESVMPSTILCSPSPAPNPSQHHGLFKWVSSSHQVAKVLKFQLQHQSFQWTPRTYLL